VTRATGSGPDEACLCRPYNNYAGPWYCSSFACFLHWPLTRTQVHRWHCATCSRCIAQERVRITVQSSHAFCTSPWSGTWRFSL